MRGFCPPRQKYRGDSVLADQIGGILSARDFVRSSGYTSRPYVSIKIDGNQSLILKSLQIVSCEISKWSF